MHDLNSPYNTIDPVASTSPVIMGKECCCCMRLLEFKFFPRDTSYRDGYRDQCNECASAPRLSTAEHTDRLRELNYSSEALKRQRWDDQEELKDDTSRLGRPMKHSDFLGVVQKLVPNLYITEGRLVGDLAIFQIAPCPQDKWGGKDFNYLFYCPSGILPEFSQYQFDEVRNIPIRESKRGWRTVLLRLVKAGLLDEATCNKIFGRAEGPAASRWNKQLWQYRNRKLA